MNSKSRETSNKIPFRVEKRIVEVSVKHPDYSSRRLVPLLEQEGIQVTASAVHAILKRNNLHTKSKRLAMLDSFRSAEKSSEPTNAAPSEAEQKDNVPSQATATKSEISIPQPIKALTKSKPRPPWALSVPNLILLGIIGYFCTSAIGNLLNASRHPLPSPLPPAAEVFSKPKADVRPLEDYAIIAERNLFGASAEEASAPQEDLSLEGLPVSLKVAGFKLLGTVASNDSTKSFAILDNPSTRQQELYHEGDKVGEALLKKVLRNKVVLNTGKGDEVLTMEFEESGQSPTVSQQPAAGQLPETIARDNSKKNDGLNSPLADLDEFMKQVKISPYLQGEQPAGATITGTSNTLARLRLRNGDTITGFKGQAITSPDQAREIFERAAQGDEVTLDILRKNRSRKIRLR